MEHFFYLNDIFGIFSAYSAQVPEVLTMLLLITTSAN